MQGLALSSYSRVELMQKLLREEAPNTTPAKPAQPTTPAAPPVVPSKNILLTNMFDPVEEAASGNPEWDKDIEEDVQAECEQFGVVNHIFVDKNSQGFVYLKFEDMDSAKKAIEKLHGRWFAGKLVLLDTDFPL